MSTFWQAFFGSASGILYVILALNLASMLQHFARRKFRQELNSILHIHELNAPPELISFINSLSNQPLSVQTKLILYRIQNQSAQIDQLYALLVDAWELAETLALHHNTIISPSAHMLFWCPADKSQAFLDFLESSLPGFQAVQFPLIWHKSNHPSSGQEPNHVYETCLLLARDRKLLRPLDDLYNCPADRTQHPEAKPEPMLKHFLTALVDPTTRILDPACGSATALLAADTLHAQTLLGLEISPDYAESAQRRLCRARDMRKLTSRSH